MTNSPLSKVAQKRPHNEINDFNKVDNPMDSVTIHGVVTTLSPIKKGRTTNFLGGTLADSSGKVRIVGFNTDHQKIIKEFMDKRACAVSGSTSWQ